MTANLSPTNSQFLEDWTEEVNELDNQFGFIKSQNIFNMRPTSQTSIVFDKNIQSTTLLPQVNRNSREATYGKDRKLETYSLPTAYFKHKDQITPQDIQDYRAPNDPDMRETLNRVRAEKLVDMRLSADQTDEYMQLQAMKGIFKTPDGSEVANMFNIFGITQQEVDFDLGNNDQSIDEKFTDIIRRVQKSVKTGGTISGVDLYVDPIMFDRLTSHPKLVEVYLNYQNSGVQRLRDDLHNYMSHGISSVFEHRGVRIISYDAEFNLPDGTSEKAFEDNSGIAVARGVRDLFRGYYGPANKLSGANQAGQPMFLREYADPRDEFRDLELEMTKLYFCTKPASIIKLTSST